jgi:hypothetical protein
MDWEFGLHTILLRLAREEVVMGRGRPVRRAEKGD